MPSPNEKLAVSLEILKELQEGGRKNIFKSTDISRTHRERLIKNRFLKEIIKGWLFSTRPSEADGDSTTWYACFWDFCALYCQERFGNQWHLSPDQSLLLQAESTVIPKQVIIYTPKGTNNILPLVFNTSLYDLKNKEDASERIITRENLRLYTIEGGLIKTSPSFFVNHALEAQIVLSQIKDASELLRLLLEGGHSTIAGRIVGAFRRVGRQKIADSIEDTMKGAGYDIRESDPFAEDMSISKSLKLTSPIVNRINSLWELNRDIVLKQISPSVVSAKKAASYLKEVDEIYAQDAYNSLSIEGYRVSPELVEKVREGKWNPDAVQVDQLEQDALAARGYWQAFQKVRTSVEKVLSGEPAGEVVRDDHALWYRELFQPAVVVGILKPSALAGYRNNPVYLRNSRFVPPRSEVVYEAMETLFDQISNEENPRVAAVLGHWLFGYIHPYPDGNGRMARFLMNVLFAAGNCPWTVIRVEDRKEYLKALDQASIEGDLKPFSDFILQSQDENVL